jgi:hypothetical protein
MKHSLMLKNVSACILAFAVTSAIALDFTGYEGKDAIREGQGGAKKTVAGVDFWSDGLPPFKFKLLGYVTDRRLKSGLLGMMSMSSLESDVAVEAKKVGGDGVIIVGAEAETTGTVGIAQANVTQRGYGVQGTGFGTTAQVQKQNSKFAVIKYMKDVVVEPTTAPATKPAVAPVEAEPKQQ